VYHHDLSVDDINNMYALSHLHPLFSHFLSFRLIRNRPVKVENRVPQTIGTRIGGVGMTMLFLKLA
jgi:hypothetical protein